MKQNTMFKIIGSFMILLTILSVVNATTISNSLSTFTGIIDMGTQQIYNITNVNTTNVYASVVNTTNLWVGLTKINASNLLPLACANNSVSKYDTATGVWLCQIDTDTDTTINVTSIQVTGTTTKILTLEQLNGITNRTATFTDLTNSSADMIFAINNTNGVFTLQGLNMSVRNTNMNSQNITYTQGSGGIILNQSQSHFSIQQNSSGCVVIKGASSTLAVC